MTPNLSSHPDQSLNCVPSSSPGVNQRNYPKMKFTIIVLVVCLAVAAFAQVPPAAQAQNAQAVAGTPAAKAGRGSGLGGLLTLGLISGNMGE